jgi:hypothetical protein
MSSPAGAGESLSGAGTDAYRPFYGPAPDRRPIFPDQCSVWFRGFPGLRADRHRPEDRAPSDGPGRARSAEGGSRTPTPEGTGS